MNEEILEYCYKPRTMAQLTKHFGKGKNVLGPRLLKLQLENKLIRRVTDQGTADMMHWYMAKQVPDPAGLAKKYSRQIMGVWL